MSGTVQILRTAARFSAQGARQRLQPRLFWMEVEGKGLELGDTE